MALLISCLVVFASQAAEPPEVRALMREAQSSLRTLLMLSAEPDGLRQPANSAESIEAIARLSDVSASLQFHMQSDDARYLADILSYQAWWMGLAFNLGQMAVVEALAHEITNVCVACHTRLPDVRAAAVAETFLPEAKLASLGTIRRAHLEAATRRFDPAVARLEQHALSPHVTWTEAERAAVLHMTLSIRVKRDMAAPRRLVAALATRSPLPPQASTTIAAWTESLQHVSLDVAAAELLPTARGLLGLPGERAAAASRSPHKLIEHLVASSMLNLLLAEHEISPAETAEASYLLGLSYSRVESASHVPLASFHLERAVKMSPEAAWAPSALQELEVMLLDMFDAKTRDELPVDALGELEELEALVRS
ncbi:MAG: hypothetical protein ACR2RL_25395 [Gammaproteobacteria bacterium]